MTDAPLTPAQIVSCLDGGDSVEVLKVLRNAIHWSGHLNLKDKKLITDAVQNRINSILNDHA